MCRHQPHRFLFRRWGFLAKLSLPKLKVISLCVSNTWIWLILYVEFLSTWDCLMALKLRPWHIHMCSPKTVQKFCDFLTGRSSMMHGNPVVQLRKWISEQDNTILGVCRENLVTLIAMKLGYLHWCHTTSGPARASKSYPPIISRFINKHQCIWPEFRYIIVISVA